MQKITWFFIAFFIGSSSVAAADLQSAQVKVQPVDQERFFDGVVEAVNQATMSAQTNGRVVEINYDVDDFVPKGAVIIRLTDKEQSARIRQGRARLSEAEALYKEADIELKRVKEIYAKKLVAKAELDRAEAGMSAAKARLDQARAALTEIKEQGSYSVVKAPYSGIATQRHVEMGESVTVGEPLMSGMSLEQLRVNVAIPQAFVKAVRTFDKASIKLTDGTRIGSNAIRIFPYADANSHAFNVRVEMPEGDYGLYPGMFVKVGFVTGHKEAILVPQSAIVRRSELTAVYVKDSAENISLRQVRLGRQYQDDYEVLAGLESGEQVMLDPVAAGAALKQQER